MPPLDFYQQLADDYHLIFHDWSRSIERQAAALDRLLNAYGLRPPLRVLDCAAGIGTQAIGLAGRGYTVHATDSSPAMIERAAREAAARGVALTTGVADLRALAGLGEFDLVLACDNALPHLLTDADLAQAVDSMRARLRPGGLLLASIRDYDHLLLSQPRATSPEVIEGNDGAGRRVVFQVWDWRDTIYDLTLFIVREEADSPGTWHTTTYRATYRAVQRAELDAALITAGFSDPRWHMPQDTGYHQPIVTAKYK